ncbi:MAG: hypothetical protein AAFX81_11850 [Pseudomonadota bacterium]
MVVIEQGTLDAVPPAGPPAVGLQVNDLDVARHFARPIRDMVAARRSQDVPATTAIAEFGPCQFEINLDHVADAVRAADQEA